jgi:hypothetical protein
VRRFNTQPLPSKRNLVTLKQKINQRKSHGIGQPKFFTSKYSGNESNIISQTKESNA